MKTIRGVSYEKKMCAVLATSFFNPPSRSASEDEKKVVNSPMLASEFWVQGLPWGFTIAMFWGSACGLPWNKTNHLGCLHLSCYWNNGDWLYGRVEVRAKLPAGRGTWPAIWMLSTDREHGGWPESGEIDIMENVGYNPDSVFASVHAETHFFFFK